MNQATTHLVLASVLLLAAACGESRVLPATPLPTTPTPPPPLRDFILTGTVYEATATGLRPLAGVGIDVSPDYQSRSPRTISDGEGGYRTSVTAEAVKVVGEKTGYGQPCRVTMTPTADVVVNLYLVSDALLSTTGVPASMPVVQPTLSGVVYEQTADGKRPVAGAGMVGDFSGGLGWGPAAHTSSDAAGRYLLCGVGAPPLGLYLNVQKPGFRRSYVSADCCLGGRFDVEITRD